MEEPTINNLIEKLQMPANEALSRMEALPVLFSFVVCISLAFVVRYFYIRHSSSIAGKLNIGNILPILSGIVFLIILVVKSSIALSLGLVGALSIVRFRTPIKEPEELVYLFLAIAVGLGCAANYLFITSAITFAILGFAFFFLSRNQVIFGANEFNLSISWESKNINFNQLIERFESDTTTISLVRYSVNPKANAAVFIVESPSIDGITSITKELQTLDKSISVTFSSPNTNW